MLPRVIVYAAVSLDGMTTGFAPDMGRFYGKAATWREGLTLAGSDTILAAPEGRAREDESPVRPPDKGPGALLAVVDSRGRVRCWNFLRNAGYWRGVIALCSHRTSRSHIDYLKRRRVECIVTGRDAVDLEAALKTLNRRHRVKCVRVESGGALNGALLRAGLVSEVSLLVHPVMVGSGKAHSFLGPTAPRRGSLPIKLVACERQEGGLVWLRYKVAR